MDIFLKKNIIFQNYSIKHLAIKVLKKDKAFLLLLKQSISDMVESKITDQMERSENAMKSAQDGANNEEKSSMGDKYETTRAMMQIERDKHAKQLHEAKIQLAFFKQLKNTKSSNTANAGSMIISGENYFYLAVGLGKLMVNENEVFVISPSSPIGQLMIGKKVGNEFNFMQKKLKIETII